MTMSTTGAWLPAGVVIAVFWLVGCWAVAVEGAGVAVCPVTLTTAKVPPDARSDAARTAPTTKPGPTVRVD